MGADDYVTKPSVCRSWWRGAQPAAAVYPAGGRKRHPDGTVVNGRLAYDPANRVLTADGETVKLTNIETGIVDLLMAQSGPGVPRGEFTAGYGGGGMVLRGHVMVHIRRIREKLSSIS